MGSRVTDERDALLLVDDEVRILSALERTLRREGYAILKAETVADALAILDSRRVALVVSDYKMPGRNGAELLAVVRTRFPGTRRVLLSGWSPDIAPHELAAAAPDAVHAKPWDDDELKSSIRSLLCKEP